MYVVAKNNGEKIRLPSIEILKFNQQWNSQKYFDVRNVKIFTDKNIMFKGKSPFNLIEVL